LYIALGDSLSLNLSQHAERVLSRCSGCDKTKGDLEALCSRAGGGQLGVWR